MKYLKSTKNIIMFILAIVLYLELISCLILFPWAGKHNYLENVYYISQFISSCFVISGVVIAVWQYFLSCKTAKNNLEIIQVQKAIDLSEYYKDNILNVIPAIKYVFEQVGISCILDDVKLEQMNDFNIQELYKLLSPQKIQKLKKYSNYRCFHQGRT